MSTFYFTSRYHHGFVGEKVCKKKKKSVVSSVMCQAFFFFWFELRLVQLTNVRIRSY